MTAYELFKQHLVGDFNNRTQIALQKLSGKQIHPFAVHVNREFTHRVAGLPFDFEGSFILEESYYDYPEEEETRLKPYLFWIKPKTTDIAELRPMVVPPHWEPKDIRNDNADFKLKYEEIGTHPWFGVAEYYKVADRLHTHHVCNLGNGKQFSLIEYFSEGRLDVMELLEENGKRMIPYSTPIIYERLPQSHQ